MPSLSLAIDARQGKIGAAEWADALSKAKRVTLDFDGTVHSTDKTVNSFGSSLADITRKASGLIAFYAAQRYIRGAVTEFATFEKGLANVSTQLDVQSMHLMPVYREELTKLQIKYGESSETLVKGLYDIIGAAIDANKAIKVLDASTIAAKAGYTTTAVAVDAITTILNSYSMNADRATYVSDRLFAAVLRGKLTFEALASSIGHVAAIAASMDLPLEEVSAAIATMTRAGLSADIAVTSLKAQLSTFLSPTKENIDAAKKLGIELSANTIATEGLFKQIEKLKGASPELTAALFSNIRALIGVATLLKQTEGYAEDLKIAYKSNGMTLEAFNKISNTTDASLNKLKESFKVIKRESIEPLIPLINNLSQSLQDATPYARAFTREMTTALNESVPYSVHKTNMYINQMLLSWNEWVKVNRQHRDKGGYSDPSLDARITKLKEIQTLYRNMEKEMLGTYSPSMEGMPKISQTDLNDAAEYFRLIGEGKYSLADLWRQEREMERWRKEQAATKPQGYIPSQEVLLALVQIKEEAVKVDKAIEGVGKADWEKQIDQMKQLGTTLKGKDLDSFNKAIDELSEKYKKLDWRKSIKDSADWAKDEAERREELISNIDDEIARLKLEHELLGKSNLEREKAMILAKAAEEKRQYGLGPIPGKVQGRIDQRAQEQIALAEDKAAWESLNQELQRNLELKREQTRIREDLEIGLEDLQTERKLLFSTNEERERTITLINLERHARGLSKEEIDEYKTKYDEELDKLKDLKKWKETADAVGDAASKLVEAPLNAILDTTKGFEESLVEELRGIGLSLMRDLYSTFVMEPIKQLAVGFFKSLIPAAGVAKGGVFDHGVRTFGKGGFVFGPTIFPMANGTGLMGEEGPEAVLPLRRNSKGVLGAQITGGMGYDPEALRLLQVIASKERSVKFVNHFDARKAMIEALNTREGEDLIQSKTVKRTRVSSL